MKLLSDNNNYLNYSLEAEKYMFASLEETDNFKTQFTRKELEDAGFGDVFNSPLFEVEKVQ